MKKNAQKILIMIGLIMGLITSNMFANDAPRSDPHTHKHTQQLRPQDPGCPGPACPDQTGGNVPIKDFHDEQQTSVKEQVSKEPCCPGYCCPDMAGGPVSIPSQQTASA
ncbi:MAG: hypothetical protein K2Q14_06065 [Gammaproteobacteria bacterium]|nr:hypothetical protein [Gammaproteobacteria bacterium]